MNLLLPVQVTGPYSLPPPKDEDRNGLYTYKLRGAYLKFRLPMGFLGAMVDVFYMDITDAVPGSRITFTYEHVGINGN